MCVGGVAAGGVLKSGMVARRWFTNLYVDPD